MLRHHAPPAPPRVPLWWPRQWAWWSPELNAAVATAVVGDQVRPPAGVSWADRERVVAARRAEAGASIEALRRLGPEVAGQLVVAIEEVLTPAPEPGRFHEMRTACLLTPLASEIRRYLSGTGAAFLRQLRTAVRACANQSLLVF